MGFQPDFPATIAFLESTIDAPGMASLTGGRRLPGFYSQLSVPPDAYLEHLSQKWIAVDAYPGLHRYRPTNLRFISLRLSRHSELTRKSPRCQQGWKRLAGTSGLGTIEGVACVDSASGDGWIVGLNRM